MLTSNPSLTRDAAAAAEPIRIGDLLPEVLARYGFANGINELVHPAHAKVSRKHPGRTRSADAKLERKEATVRMPAARRLSAAG